MAIWQWVTWRIGETFHLWPTKSQRNGRCRGLLQVLKSSLLGEFVVGLNWQAYVMCISLRIFRGENVEIIRDTVCKVKIIICVRRNCRFSRSEFSKLNKVSNYRFKGYIDIRPREACHTSLEFIIQHILFVSPSRPCWISNSLPGLSI